MPPTICPITRELMCDPVNTVDGNAYERAAIRGSLVEK